MIKCMHPNNKRCREVVIHVTHFTVGAYHYILLLFLVLPSLHPSMLQHAHDVALIYFTFMFISTSVCSTTVNFITR